MRIEMNFVFEVSDYRAAIVEVRDGNRVNEIISIAKKDVFNMAEMPKMLCNELCEHLTDAINSARPSNVQN